MKSPSEEGDFGGRDSVLSNDLKFVKAIRYNDATMINHAYIYPNA
jgi:hypothetical protein